MRILTTYLLIDFLREEITRVDIQCIEARSYMEYEECLELNRDLISAHLLRVLVASIRVETDE